MTLREVLAWLMSSGGAAAIAFALMDRVWWLEELAPQPKRFVAFGITAGLACGAFGVCVAMGYNPVPADWRAWVEVLVFTATTAIVLGQGVHGAVRLGRGRALP